MIQVIRFSKSVHFGGDIGDVDFYKRVGGKFGDISATDTGNGFVEFQLPGRVLRVPYSNIDYMAVEKVSPMERPTMKKGGQL